MLVILARELYPVITSWTRQWPRNAIALSKRLQALKASLHGHGIGIEFGRGQERQIKITSLKDF